MKNFIKWNFHKFSYTVGNICVTNLYGIKYLLIDNLMIPLLYINIASLRNWNSVIILVKISDNLMNFRIIQEINNVSNHSNSDAMLTLSKLNEALPQKTSHISIPINWINRSNYTKLGSSLFGGCKEATKKRNPLKQRSLSRATS